MTLLDRILQHPDVVKPPNSKGEATAWCPWHLDKSGSKPNLGINVNKKTVKCWVCGEPTRQPFKSLALAWGLASPQGTAPRGQITSTYDYRNAAGALVFQVVRLQKPDGSKDFRQRRPDPNKEGEWIWNLQGVERVVYRLPELMEMEPGTGWVYIVEGEKDADALAELGLIATTNPGGVGKWNASYNSTFRDHKVAIIPDNDSYGKGHALKVAQHLMPFAAFVRISELEGLPPKGDASDWLAAGHGSAELQATVEGTPAFQLPGDSNGNGVTMQAQFWEGGKWRPLATRIVQDLRANGFFVSADGLYYYFDHTHKRLCEVGDFELALILNDRYQVNQADSLYNYLVHQLEVEASIRGVSSVVRQFAHYDAEKNVLFLDMNDGKVLRLDGKKIEVRENGLDGVLFAPTRIAEPWEYIPTAPEELIAETIIAPLNFVASESTPYTPDQQRLLMLLWMLSAAFESVQPTKPIALAIGPSGSGKSLLFRRMGKLLFGPKYQVDAIRRDKEDEWWTTVTTNPFATFDNVDAYIPWLNDALAQCATGVQVTKRKLYTSNTSVAYTPRCMISLTARTPSFRREDVASRLLVFYMDRLPAKRAEYELLEEIRGKRNELMSDYAHMLNRVLACETPPVVDQNIRLADFAGVAARIGAGLGVDDMTRGVLNALRRSQTSYATEDNSLVLAIDAWLSQVPNNEEEMDLGQTNHGRAVTTSQLYKELSAVAKDLEIPWFINGPQALGMQIRNMDEELRLYFQITHARNKTKRTVAFEKVDGEEI